MNPSRSRKTAVWGLVSLTLLAGCGGKDGPDLGKVERNIARGLERQVHKRPGGENANVKSVDCVERGGGQARCFATVKLDGGDQQVGIDVTFGKDNRYIWETTP